MKMQLDLPDTKVEELNILMNKTGIATYKELFNNALTLLEWAVDQTKAGRAIASIDEEHETYRLLLMPVLETLAHNGKMQTKTKGAVKTMNASAAGMNFAMG
jgi:hypothetical protein